MAFTYTNKGLITDNVDEALKILNEHGVAVLKGRLTDKECHDLNDKMWDALEDTSHGEIQRNDETTYSKNVLGAKYGGLIQQYIGHADYIWDIRSNPKVMEIYCKLYKCNPEDLLVSFDGVTIGIAHLAPGDKGTYKGVDWLHMDQAPCNSKFQCIQSWVTTNNVRPGDGTLRCLLGSHKYHANFVKAYKLQYRTNDWYKLTPTQVEWYVRRCKDICITCPAGSQVLWDSRTIHSGIQSMPLDKHPCKILNPRNVVYVCYQPRPPPGPLLDHVISWRKEIFNPKNADKYLRMTSHWPLKGRLFTRHSTATMKKQKKPKTLKPTTMSKLAERIAGLTC